MKKINKKGFTLVELLAVIVILALIMSIAVISMSGIMQSARQSTLKETAMQIMNGVRQQLTLADELKLGNISTTGTRYYFTSNIIEKGGKTSPLGGDFAYITIPAANSTANTVSNVVVGKDASNADVKHTLTRVGMVGVYRDKTLAPDCSATTMSYVLVKYNSTTKNFDYSICLTAGAGNKYINDANGTDAKLLDSNDLSMIS